ncbi:MAG: VCBS repeat-containing protein [Planctomycetes bacterium]|nr:VCBS repeat-containing protein [Planctomycetota bacterium]
MLPIPTLAFALGPLAAFASVPSQDRPPVRRGALPTVEPDVMGYRVLATSWFGAQLLPSVGRGPKAEVRLLVYDSSRGAFWSLGVDGESALLVAGADGTTGDRGEESLLPALDFDGDGGPEFLNGSPGAWTLRSGATSETLLAYSSIELCPIGDIDLDGVPEIAFARELSPANGRGPRLCVSVRSHRAVDDLWQFDASIAYAYEPRHLLAAGDLDRDGRADLLALIEDRAVVFSGRNGARIVELGESGRLPARRAARLGDLDGDGVADFVLGYPDGSCSQRNLAHVDVLSGKDGRRIHRLRDPSGMFGVELAAGSDLDGDGCPDFAVAMHGGPEFEGVRVYSGATARTVAEFESEWNCHRQFSVSFLPDVDADGVDDLAIGATAWPGANCDDGSVTLWSGKSAQLLRTWTAKSPVIVEALRRARSTR